LKKNNKQYKIDFLPYNINFVISYLEIITMGGFRIFVMVGIPIIVLACIVTLALWMCFPKQFKEVFPCCPCAIKQKTKIIEVPVEVPILIHDTQPPPKYLESTAI
jgi:hypothetical protein